MTDHDDAVLTLVRAADPLDVDELERWLASSAPARIHAAATTRPSINHRRRRTAALVVIGVAATSIAAAAATGHLGRPAPDRVKAHIAELDHGLPADLQANPDLDSARLVAESPSAALFAANTADGGYCIEVVTGADTPRGATCVAAARVSSLPIEVTSPIARNDEPVILAGRVNVAGSTSVQLVLSGETIPVALDDDGYWIVELSEAPRAQALAAGVVVDALDGSGAVLAETSVPALEDAAPPDGLRSPIEVTTESNGDDLTLVIAIAGTVNDPSATALDVTFPDGTVVPLELGSNGAFRYVLPAERQHDLAIAPAQLVARSADGTVVGTAPVGSVAFWHRQHG